MLVAVLGSVLWFDHFGRTRQGLARMTFSAFAAAGAGIVALALLGGGSKMQFAAPPLLLMLVGCLTLWNFFLGAGPRFAEHNNYHAVFGGILRVTSHPERALAELEVPPQYASLPRTEVWTAKIGLDHPVHQSLRDRGFGRGIRESPPASGGRQIGLRPAAGSRGGRHRAPRSRPPRQETSDRRGLGPEDRVAAARGGDHQRARRAGSSCGLRWLLGRSARRETAPGARRRPRRRFQDGCRRGSGRCVSGGG